LNKDGAVLLQAVQFMVYKATGCEISSWVTRKKNTRRGLGLSTKAQKIQKASTVVKSTRSWSWNVCKISHKKTSLSTKTHKMEASVSWV